MFISEKKYRFLLGGSLTFFTTIILTYVLTDVFNFYYLHSYVFSFGIIFFLGFLLNKYYVFNTHEKTISTIPKYLITVLFFLILNPNIVYVLTTIFGIYYIFSVIITTIFSFILKFLIYDRFIFKNTDIQSRKL